MPHEAMEDSSASGLTSPKTCVAVAATTAPLGKRARKPLAPLSTDLFLKWASFWRRICGHLVGSLSSHAGRAGFAPGTVAGPPELAFDSTARAATALAVIIKSIENGKSAKERNLELITELALQHERQ